MVFDKSFVAGLPETNSYYNPQVVALCKFPHLLGHRKQIEAWFDNIPDSEKADIKARLKSIDDGQHMGALYELVLHQFCIEEGWKTELHHLTEDGLTPDLKVTPPPGPFILEIYTQQDEEGFRKLQVVMNKLNDTINNLKTPLTLSIHYQSYPPLNIDLGDVAKDIQTWLGGLDTTLNETFRHELQHLGLGIYVTAKRRDNLKIKGGGCVFSIIGPATTGLPGTGKIINKLKIKRKKYTSSKTQLPLVVAVCDGTSQSWWGPSTIDKALFGWPVITFSIDGSDEAPQAGRDNSGLITPKQTKEGYFAQNRGISAVLYCSRMQEDHGNMKYQMLVYHNPWAYIPLPVDIFEKMPQLVITRNDKVGLALEWNMENWENSRVVFE